MVEACARAACGASPARWWNTSTRAFYCRPCALRINEANPGICRPPASLGFTGTRIGMTGAQMDSVDRILNWFEPIAAEAHHGGCVGADVDFHNLAWECVGRVYVHPGADGKMRGYCQKHPNVAFLPPKPNLERNRDVVEFSDVLIATPKEVVRRLVGGTWYTINFAVEKNKTVLLVFPDGKVGLRGNRAWPFEIDAPPSWLSTV